MLTVAEWLALGAVGGATLVLAGQLASRRRVQPRRSRRTRTWKGWLSTLIDNPALFRFLALLGLLISIWLALHAYKTDDTKRLVFDPATAAQALAGAIAGAALLVAVWAVIVTRSIADSIEASGRNDDKIAANNRLQEQWQTINLEFIRHPTLRPRWEPDVPGDAGVDNFEVRLGFTFYIMQILKLTMLYDQQRIDTSFNEKSKLYWADWMLTGNARVWKWVTDKGRGFSPEDLATVERWARMYRRAFVSTAFVSPTAVETTAAALVRQHQLLGAEKTELLVCLTGDGCAVIDAATGERDRVELTPAMIDACTDGGVRLYHNHPEQGSLSQADWTLALAHPGIVEIAAVNSNGTIFRGKVNNRELLSSLVNSLGGLRDQTETAANRQFGFPMTGYDLLPEVTWLWSDVLNRCLADLGAVYHESAYGIGDRITLDKDPVVAMETWALDLSRALLN